MPPDSPTTQIDSSIVSYINTITQYKSANDFFKETYEKANEKLEKLGGLTCNTIPDPFGFLRIPCYILRIVIFLFTYVAELLYIAISQILEGVLVDLGLQSNVYEYKLYYEELARDQWTTESLSIINKNMHDQHLAMRSQLQKRHEDILNKVNIYTNCRVDLHGIDMVRDTSG